VRVANIQLTSIHPLTSKGSSLSEKTRTIGIGWKHHPVKKMKGKEKEK
jgi:hypothetical protein